MITLALAISGVIMLLTVSNWRAGLLSILLIGVLQDVFRKLTYGAPAYFVLWSTALYGLVVLAALMQRGLPPPLANLSLRDRGLRLLLVAFLSLVALQCINAIVRFGSPAVAILGALFYVGPFVAMLVAVGFFDSEARMRKFLTTYLVVFIPTCLTVYLSPSLSADFPVLRDVGFFIGQEMVIYDIGTRLASHPGLLRVGEFAAWHAATCIAFLSILTLLSRQTLTRVVYTILMVSMVGVIILTGRRKMLAAITIFFAIQWGLLLWYRFGIHRMGVMIVALGIAIAGVLLIYEPSEQTSLYLQRGQTVYKSTDSRLETTWSLVKSAVGWSEGIGLGAGSVSQGSRFVGTSMTGAGGAAESGFGRVVVELGLLGFLLLLALIVRAASEVTGKLNQVKRLGDRLLIFQISFIALLAANMATFAIASQLFSDLFVLIILGTIAGFIVRIHNFALDQQRGRSNLARAK